MRGRPSCRDQAAAEGKTIRETAVEAGLFTEGELDVIFAPAEVTYPASQESENSREKRKRGSMADQTLNETPRGSRLHIAIFGRRNAGKSSLINALTNQSIAIVSDVPGTTTIPSTNPWRSSPSARWSSSIPRA